jgi:hypothetical protein
VLEGADDARVADDGRARRHLAGVEEALAVDVGEIDEHVEGLGARTSSRPKAVRPSLSFLPRPKAG